MEINQTLEKKKKGLKHCSVMTKNPPQTLCYPHYFSYKFKPQSHVNYYKKNLMLSRPKPMQHLWMLKISAQSCQIQPQENLASTEPHGRPAMVSRDSERHQKSVDRKLMYMDEHLYTWVCINVNKIICYPKNSH